MQLGQPYLAVLYGKLPALKQIVKGEQMVTAQCLAPPEFAKNRPNSARVAGLDCRLTFQTFELSTACRPGPWTGCFPNRRQHLGRLPRESQSCFGISLT